MSVRPKRGYDPRMNERCVYVKCSSEDLGGWRGAGAVTPGVVVEHATLHGIRINELAGL